MQQREWEAPSLFNLCRKPRTCEYLEQAALAFPNIADSVGDIKAKTLFWMLKRGIADYSAIAPEILDAVSFAAPKLAVVTDNHGIARELSRLQYPIYFFDYETYASPLPPFEGTKPYQNIPFQYSLSIKDAPTTSLRHTHYLATRFENPVRELLGKLQGDIGPIGSIVVWFAPFESRRNEEMAVMEPTFAKFLSELNERMFDLMLLFKPKNNLYLHSEFKGSASLKTVLPVLCPELSYDQLAIREGATAAASWPLLTSGALSDPEKKTLEHDMIAYCQRDTDAMAGILDHVLGIKVL
ncbi:MAG: DUF2779 domain-containing protein [Candidatus Saccharimonadales bacterium]